MSTFNQAYDIQEARPWWQVRLLALGLTVALAVFIVVAFTLVVAGPALAAHLADRFGLGAAFTWTWLIVQWPLVFALVAFAVAIVYYYAPDAEQEWIWITPGSLLATVLWIVISLGFRAYVTRFGGYNATYGAIGGVIVLLVWFYVSALALIAGAELNAEAEHASAYGKDPGEKKPGEKKKIGRLAERFWRRRQRRAQAAAVPAAAMMATTRRNCDLDAEGSPPPDEPGRARASDWILSGIVLGEAALLTFFRLRTRFRTMAH